jgi:hypothetical protein
MKEIGRLARKDVLIADQPDTPLKLSRGSTSNAGRGADLLGEQLGAPG